MYQQLQTTNKFQIESKGTKMNTIANPTIAAEAVSTEAVSLAGRGQRLAACIVDGLTMAAGSLPATLIFATMGVPGILAGIMGTAVGVGVFCALNYKLLAQEGQTIGKRLLKVKIVGADNQVLPVATVLTKRYLPVWIATAIPFIGGLIALADAVLIFENARKCGHDLIANTKVINA